MRETNKLRGSPRIKFIMYVNNDNTKFEYSQRLHNIMYSSKFYINVRIIRCEMTSRKL